MGSSSTFSISIRPGAFHGTGLDISNINVVSSYSGIDRMVISPNCTTFDVKSEFNGMWDLQAFKNDVIRKIDTKTNLDGEFGVDKELIFKRALPLRGTLGP